MLLFVFWEVFLRSFTDVRGVWRQEVYKQPLMRKSFHRFDRLFCDWLGRFVVLVENSKESGMDIVNQFWVPRISAYTNRVGKICTLYVGFNEGWCCRCFRLDRT